MSQDRQYKLVSELKPARIALPVIIGLAVVGWFIVREIDNDAMSHIRFTWNSVFWIFVAWLCMVGRDLGYMIRIRILSEKDLTWLQAFRIIMLWEFTSALTPSTVGGTAVAVVFIHKEGISVGRSTSIVLATSFLDELYFVIMFPLILLVVGGDVLFTTSLQGTGIALLNNLVVVAVIGYVIILAWVILVGYGLFVDPKKIRKIIIWFFRLPILKRWHKAAVKAGDDIVESSNELKKKPFMFWIKAFTATFLSWTSRYWVVNAILLAFLPLRITCSFCPPIGYLDHDDNKPHSRRQRICRTDSRKIHLRRHRGRPCNRGKPCPRYRNNMEDYKLLSIPDHRCFNCSRMDTKEVRQTGQKALAVFRVET